MTNNIFLNYYSLDDYLTVKNQTLVHNLPLSQSVRRGAADKTELLSGNDYVRKPHQLKMLAKKEKYSGWE